MYDTVTIQILGQEYTVRAGGDERHIQSLSRYINEKVFDIQQRGKAVTTTELVAMAMLHMAEDVAKTRQELETLRRTVSERIGHLIEHIETATR
ncbi:MAG TPA: cell division protein ZapA [Deltaproteobacteria bacterium]|nr:cell division protein ZapA [Deltaproteobacteria bacterium]OQC26830.1 MAG: Cell division protein ZapA [Deltaproteobacteria bacterium ADurb.Bin072]HRW81311.1 cell division protein ZapA [Desulfomonilia bacterium]HNQ86801.1 cell division protein ZapA [Deltaproteobacteria bacterium]HNS91044.1 cell division protein ZapA [Deltaproteobacteria bacterium]